MLLADFIFSVSSLLKSKNQRLLWTDRSTSLTRDKTKIGYSIELLTIVEQRQAFNLQSPDIINFALLLYDSGYDIRCNSAYY